MLIDLHKYFFYIKKIFRLINSYLGSYDNWDIAEHKKISFFGKKFFSMFKDFLKFIVPYAFLRIINKALKRDIRIIGEYSNWKEASSHSFGYDDDKIFNKSKKSFLAIINNKAAYERDSVLFYKDNINYSLIKILNDISFASQKIVNVLDFGGSFASTYFQNKQILKNKKKFIWSVIEQKQIVNYVNSSKLCKKINNLYDNLNFYLTIKDCLRHHSPDLVLFSGVLQYLSKPFNILKFFISKKIKYFLILRTPFHKTAEQIKIQVVPKYIYKSSYPIRIFNEESFLKYFFKNNYRTVPANFKNESIDNYNFKNFFLKYK
jgi:putative methyltransferase (TIGR04325 family)